MKRALLFAMLTLSPGAGWASTQPFLGEIEWFPYPFCPVGWLPTDGRLLEISQNTALFSLIGTNFGGNATTNFALPMLKQLESEAGGLVTPCIATNPGFVFPLINSGP